MDQMVFRQRNLLSLLVSIALLPFTFSTYADEKKINLGRVQVSDNREKDKEGYAQVYEKDVANVYLGKELLERYQGVSPADLLKSAIGVYSGEARNGGALDPNIRGIQGQGRIPVTVDGTEQAITVYRGYSGASNRNYIDSNLISSIYIEKGPSLTPDMKTGTGGGVAIKTLNIRDIVPEGETFGINIKGDIGNNTVKYKDIYLNMVEEYRYYPEFYENNTVYMIDPALAITPQKGKIANFKDYALRLGVGFEQEKFNLLAAYAIREKGNYIAGKRNAAEYSEEGKDLMQTAKAAVSIKEHNPYLPFIAHIYRPENEVSNTSSRNRSLLIKGTLFPQQAHRFAINYRYSNLLFGDIMPSRLRWFRPEFNVINQWPLGDITQQAGSLTYQWKPDDKKSDLLLRLWSNLTSGHTNTRGGWPRRPVKYDFGSNKNTLWSYKTDTRFIDTASLYQNNNRYGADFSSTFKLSPQFSLSIMGNYQFEQLKNQEIDLSKVFHTFAISGRSGRRHEINFSLSTDWKPLPWLAFNAGGKYRYYHLTDDYLNNKRRNKVKGFEKSAAIRGYLITYRRVLTAEEYLYSRAIINDTRVEIPKEYRNYRINRRNNPELFEKIEQFRTMEIVYVNNMPISQELKNEIVSHPDMDKRQSFFDYTHSIRDKHGNIQQYITEPLPMAMESTPWLLNDKGELTKSNNIFHNGQLDINEKVPHPATGESVYKYEIFTEGATKAIYEPSSAENQFPLEPAYQHGAWSPLMSATVYASEMLRFYGRYTEQLRLPSLFEDTTGFSGSKARYYGFKLKPERAKSTEFGAVLDLSSQLNHARHADIKLNIFSTQIENVFDRDDFWRIRQLDKQILEGLELQARYDNGFVFLDTAFVLNHKNKVCDKNAFKSFDPIGIIGMPDCVVGGYPGGFLRNSIQPKYSVNLHVGTRWLDEKLEIGSRWLYSAKAENKDEKRLKEAFPVTYYGMNNNPMRWAPVFTVDAYINYQYNSNLSFEIVGSNLLNEYYIDPLTRSGMPAPGRTIKFSVTAQF